MKINVIVQPDKVFGEVILEKFSSKEFSKLWIVSAFANEKAVSYLEPSVLAMKNRGAEIRIVVGMDLKSTTSEALKKILELNVDSKVFHNATSGHTFHPKIYLFEAEDKAAEIFVGSNNLTAGGLSGNYEASIHIIFNFPDDEVEYEEIKNSLNRFLNPTGDLVQSLSKNLIQVLSKRGDIISEKEARKNRAKLLKTDKRKVKISSPFGSEKVKRLSVVSTRTKKNPPKTATEKKMFGELLWKKENLPASDAQRPETGNPVGGLRLTQADWEIDGVKIDQTTYFRNEVFGNFDWQPWRVGSEKTSAKFDIRILDKHYGVFEIEI
ncbi:MAG: restriction endonuclease PLD domain-containing protein, partial [Pyrinomonadaceae bacterium]